MVLNKFDNKKTSNNLQIRLLRFSRFFIEQPKKLGQFSSPTLGGDRNSVRYLDGKGAFVEGDGERGAAEEDDEQ